MGLTIRDWVLLVFLLFTPVVEVEGHGTLIFPAAKGYAWRLGFGTPADYNHMGKNCGGFAKQWNPPNNGECGYCGDPRNGPFENEQNGKFDNQVIVATFSKNQNINVKVEITSAHQGYFMFEICTASSLDLTADCKAGVNVYPVQLTNGRYKYDANSVSGGIVRNGIYTIPLRLPTGLWCSPRCVFKWKYHAGNNWGSDADGTSGLGKGPQEEFHNCANIEITDPDEGEIPAPVDITTITTTPTTTTTPTATTTAPATGTGTTGTLICRARDTWPNWKDDTNELCTSMCNDDPSNCPEERCLCWDAPPCRCDTSTDGLSPSPLFSPLTLPSSLTCVAIGAWKDHTVMEHACQVLCNEDALLCPVECDCATKPDTEQPDTEQPDTEQPNTEQPDTPQTDTPQTDTPQTDTSQTDTSQTDTPQTDTPQTDTPQTNIPQTDTPQTYTEQPDTPQTDTPQTYTEQPDTPQTDTPQTDTEQSDTEQSNTPQTDTEQPDTEQPNSEQSDTEQSDTEQPDSEQTDTPQPISQTSCHGIHPFDTDDGIQWCYDNCNHVPPYCPESRCSPGCKNPATEQPDTEQPDTEQPINQSSCHGIHPFNTDDGIQWCYDNCNHVPPYCPESHCSPGCKNPVTEQPTTEQPDTEQPNTEQPDTEQPDTEQPISQSSCHGIPPHDTDAGITWCLSNCNHVPPHCPESHCSPGCKNQP